MAKRYTFRLETLLRLRQQREDEKKRVVAARLREIRTLQQRRQFLETEIDRHTTDMRDSLIQQWMDVEQVKLGRHWVMHLRRGALETDAQISAQRALLALERSTLAEARKETKVLDRLKERQRVAYLSEVNRREQIELDEMNVSRFAHAVMAENSE